MVYDVTKEKSFANVRVWIEGLKYQADPDLIIILVGNKIDLCEKNPQMRKVTKEEAANFAHENKLLFEETSAITDQNIAEVFERLLQGNERIYVNNIILWWLFRNLHIEIEKRRCRKKKSDGVKKR